ncbi:MAG: hypothetical protein QXY90_06040 [Candidatus Anstonellales archaeon]
MGDLNYLKLKILKQILIPILLVVLPSLTTYADDVDKLSGKNVKASYDVESKTPFKIIITDDPADRIDSKGMIRIFYYSKGYDFELPFHLEKGKSGTWEIGKDEGIPEKIIIELQEGSILINHGNELKKEMVTAKPPQKVTLPKGSFSADTIMNIKGNLTKGKIYLKDHLYRYDAFVDKKKKSTIEDKIKTPLGSLITQITVEERNSTIIVNRETGKSLILDHDEKAYLEGDISDTILYNNPVEAFNLMSEFKEYKVIEKGEESIEGLVCEKKEIRLGNLLVQTAWISKKYGIPIKFINYSQDQPHTIFEVKNIKEMVIEPKIFQAPKGYKQKKKD